MPNKIFRFIFALSLLLTSLEIMPAIEDAVDTSKQDLPITKENLSMLIAHHIIPDVEKGFACEKSQDAKKFVVDVAATTLWKEPNIAREIDLLATSNLVDIKKWNSGLTLPEKQWLIGKVETQALYGEEVIIINHIEDWVQVAVKSQYTPKNTNGYPGWVPSTHIVEASSNYEDCSIAIIDNKTATLYSEKDTDSKFMELSFNTRLPILKEEEKWVHVQTPSNGIKYLHKQDVSIYEEVGAIIKPSQQDILETAKQFIDLPYLWAGTSGFGFDCSGFTFSVYNRHGIEIPRDSGVQAVNGTAISNKNLQPGDLLFFANNGGKGQVHHVGMYIGNGQMIHAPNPKRAVEIMSIHIEPYKSEYAGARRYLE